MDLSSLDEEVESILFIAREISGEYLYPIREQVSSRYSFPSPSFEIEWGL